jgi:hypothetical protein
MGSNLVDLSDAVYFVREFCISTSSARVNPGLKRKTEVIFAILRLQEALMSQVLDEVLAANEAYVAAFGDKGTLPLPPGRWRDVGSGPGSSEGEFIDWLPIGNQGRRV